MTEKSTQKYYQPEYNEEAWDEKNFFSFMVFINKKEAQDAFPSLKILEYYPIDIEDPVIVSDNKR